MMSFPPRARKAERSGFVADHEEPDEPDASAPDVGSGEKTSDDAGLPEGAPSADQPDASQSIPSDQNQNIPSADQSTPSADQSIPSAEVNFPDAGSAEERTPGDASSPGGVPSTDQPDQSIPIDAQSTPSEDQSIPSNDQDTPPPDLSNSQSDNQSESDSTDIAENVAEVAENFPQISSIRFATWDEGDGITMNTEFWDVTYIMTKEDKRQVFRATANQSAYKASLVFRGDNPKWNYYEKEDKSDQTIYSYTISVGAHGASSAINDLFGSGSALYAVECRVGTALMVLGGIYQSYKKENRPDEEFDAKYNSFSISSEAKGVGTLEECDLEEISGTELSLREFEKDPIKSQLIRGDVVYIECKSCGKVVEESPFHGENAIYLGGEQFSGHGVGIFDPRIFAKKVAGLVGGEEAALDKYMIVKKKYRPIKNQ